MASSGNTWFKKLRTKGKSKGFLSAKFEVPNNALAKRSDRFAVNPKYAGPKPVKPRDADKRQSTGFVMVVRGSGTAAKRAAYHARLGFPA